MGKSSNSDETRPSWKQVEIHRSSDDAESSTLGPALARLLKSEIFLILAPLLVVLCLPFPLAALFDSTEEVAAESAPVQQPEAGGGLETVFGRSRNFIADTQNGSAPETGSNDSGIDGTLEWLPDAIDPNAPRNLARELVERITYGEYEFSDDVATGRFLKFFENMSIILEDIDMTGAVIRRRTSRWVLMAARYAPPYVEIEGTAEIRFVIVDGRWMVEHVKLFRRVPFSN